MHDTLYFTEEHRRLRDTVRDFAERVIRPSARRYDADGVFPWDNVKQMADLGLFGVPWPEELGGAGMDYIAYMIVIHELAKVDASHAITVGAPTNLGTSPIMDFGTPEQKRQYVPRLASGRVLGGFGLTEAGAGSDAGGTRTVAVDKGDHYVLNGAKVFITHGGVGEIFIVSARTDPTAQKTRGITAFIVTKDTTDLAEATRVGVGHDPTLPKCPGVLAGQKEDKLGWPASAPWPWASPKARSRNACATPRPAPSSGNRSRASRASTSRSPTWPPKSRRPRTSSITPPGSNSGACRSRKRRPWPSCTPRSSRCAPPPRRSSSTAATATPPTTRWSA